jgi:hypothetical protein
MAVQESLNAKKSNTGIRSCCIGCLIFLLVALAAGFALFDYLKKEFQNIEEASVEEAKKYDQLYLDNQPDIFLESMPPNYQLSEKEETAVYSQIDKLEDEGKKSQMKQIAETLKKYYPEGYFILIKNISLAPTNFPVAADLWLEDKNTVSQTHLFLHEFSHFGEAPCFFEKRKCPVFKLKKYGVTTVFDKPKMGYWIEDKTVNMKMLEGNRLIPGKKVFPYAKKPIGEESTDGDSADSVRKHYLDSANETIDISLDEVNSYMKDLRLSRAIAYQEKNQGSATEIILRKYLLAEQMYIVSLHLKVAKENFPDSWNYLVKHKDFAYVLMKMINSAEKEIEFSQEEIEALKKAGVESGVAKLNLGGDPLELYNENREILESYFSESKVKELRDKNLTVKDLNAMGISVSKY